MRSTLPLTLLLCVLSTTALATPSHAAPDRQAMDNEPQFINGRLVLPAWETRWERMARLRKDTDTQLDAFRTAHPELYGVTTPPVGQVTFYAEYAPVDAVYYVWEPGVFDPFFHAITHELITDGSSTAYILHHGNEDRATLEAYITGQGDDPADASFIDVATLGDYYEWQTESPYDRSLDSFWTVDFGPFWVEDGAGVLSIIDPRYYFWRINDDTVPAKLAAALGVNVFRPDLGFEGGNLFSDGLGTCFGTGVHVAYNAAFTEQEINDQLFDYFGCEKMFWLEPMFGEGTGHVDMFFKNASATTLIVGEYDAAMDPANAAVLDYNASLLAAETNAAGEPFEVLRVPMPDNSDGVFRSYTNGIVVNDLVLVPTYSNHSTHEAAALTVFEQAFSGRTVVAIDSESIIEWGGAIHCVTRTRPVGTLQQMETPPTDACGGDYQCISDCGDLDFTGDCIYGIPVWCEGGMAAAESCYADQRCGWDLAQDYFFCVDAGCGDLSESGECRTTAEGDDVVVTCSADGFPTGARCPAGTECAVLSTGEAGCRAPCTDDCAAEDQGCNADGDPWTCGEADDGDDCWEEIVSTCGADETCEAGACVCVDACAAGEGGCDADGYAWTCGEAGDGDTCLEPMVAPCAESEECQDGTCVARPTKKGCGCASAGPGPGDLGGLLLMLALLGLVGWIRRT
jgi:MYXO-CTERM domain-containing protein